MKPEIKRDGFPETYHLIELAPNLRRVGRALGRFLTKRHCETEDPLDGYVHPLDEPQYTQGTLDFKP